MFRTTVLAALLALVTVPVFAQETAPAPATLQADAEIEHFLRTARVVKTKRASKGITASLRATLTDGTITHDAQIQDVDEYKGQFSSAQGVELNFRDSWSYNVAAYKLDRLLGINLVPVSVARAHNGRKSAFTWWVDDVLMDEGERLKKKLTAPNAARWNAQMWTLRVFDQLIGNTDRNLGNLLIGNDWRIWAIDHTRAFRAGNDVRVPANVTRCDRQVFERIKALDRPTLQKVIGEYMYTNEILALLSRRDQIVAILEKAGPAAFYDR